MVIAAARLEAGCTGIDDPCAKTTNDLYKFIACCVIVNPGGTIAFAVPRLVTLTASDLHAIPREVICSKSASSEDRARMTRARPHRNIGALSTLFHYLELIRLRAPG